MKSSLLPVAILSLLLSGCSAAQPPADAKHTPSPPPADGGTYSTVADLMTAFKKAGGECPSWNENDVVSLAAQSGNCSDSSVLSIYTTTSARDAVVANMKAIDADMKEMNVGGHGLRLLVGANWIVNSPEAPHLASKLGGTAVTTK